MACALNFGRPIQFLEELAQAVANYVATVAQRLRRQNSLASSLTVFIQTSRFKMSGPQYSNSGSKTILFPTAFTPDLIAEALQLLREIFQPGYIYRKAGVLLGKIVPQDTLQGDLFEMFSLELHEKKTRLMETVDLINETWGNNTLFFGVQGIQRDWKMRQAKRSSRYTTQWQELFAVTRTIASTITDEKMGSLRPRSFYFCSTSCTILELHPKTEIAAYRIRKGIV